MSTFTSTLGVTAVVVGLAMQPALAQDGRLLDANPRVGSQGVNSLRSVESLGRPLGNLLVTGQVTGGFAFRGRVPYSGRNELRLTLPSESLENFNRDSIGIQNVLGGQRYRPQAFFKPSSTVYTARDAAAGRLAPGTGALTPCPRSGAPVIGPTGGTTLIPSAGGGFAGPSLSPILSMAQMNKAALSHLTLHGAAESLGEGRPRMSALFGVLDSRQSERLADELMSREEREAIRRGPPGVRTGDQEDQGVAPQEAPAEDEPARFTKVADLMAKPTRDDDLFDEVVLTLLRRRDETFRAAVAAPLKADEDLEQLNVDPAVRIEGRQKTPGALMEATGGQIVLHGLGGKRLDRFNTHVSRGDRKIKQGRFYEAATHYETAQIADRSNPLAPVGAGLAYLGAGEPYRGSHFLQRALKVFPPLMGVRIDIDGILGKTVADQRLGQIEERLSGQVVEQDVPLVFLAAYIHANRGDVRQATVWAGKLKALAGDDPALSAYAEHVLSVVEVPTGASTGDGDEKD